MRESVAALALIQKERNGERAFLTQWNAHWNCFYLLGGHKCDDETFFECVQLELEEELRLKREINFWTTPQPLSHVEFTAWSRAAGEETRYIMELFVVVFTHREALQQAESDPLNRWLTPEEIVAGRTHDNRPVSETLARLLRQFGLIEEG